MQANNPTVNQLSFLFFASEDTSVKRCTKCKKTLSLECFHKEKKMRDGLRNICKECAIKISRQNYADNKEARSVQRKEYRATHKEVFAYRDKQYQINNREKINAYNRQYRSNNKKKFLIQSKKHRDKRRRENIIYNRQYRSMHKEAIAVYVKQYRIKNRDAVNAYNRNHRALHREARNAYIRKWSTKNREKMSLWQKKYRQSTKGQLTRQASGANRRARKKSVKGTYTPLQIQDQLKRQRHKCYYCHAKFKKQNGKCIYHIEHTYPLSRVAGSDIAANSIDYLVLACPTCNLSKGDKFPWEFWEGGRLL